MAQKAKDQMKSYVELRDSEGGADAKALVELMANAYIRAAEQRGLKAKPHV